MNEMNAGEARSKTPVHLWIVGVLALLWNAMGAFDYLATQLELDFYMSRFTEQQLAYFYGFPKLMTACGARLWVRSASSYERSGRCGRLPSRVRGWSSPRSTTTG